MIANRGKSTVRAKGRGGVAPQKSLHGKGILHALPPKLVVELLLLVYLQKAAPTDPVGRDEEEEEEEGKRGDQSVALLVMVEPAANGQD